MAFADLSFAAALWQGRGLRWLAAPADLPPGLSLCAEPAVAGRAAVPSGASPSTAARNAGASRPADRPPRPPRRDAGTPPPRRAAKEDTAPPVATPGARWRPLAPADLPEAWRTRLAATRAGLVAWTYWALGQDLTPARTASGGAPAGTDEQARDGRRAFLARLLRDLAHPAGTHTFWPACLPATAEGGNSGKGAPAPDFAPHAEAFWSGAAHLGCRAVIVMGSAAARALGLPPTARPFSQLRWRGQLVLVLRDVDALAQDATRYAPTLAFLRQGLAPVARVSSRQAGV